MPVFSSSNPYQPLDEPAPEPTVVSPKKTFKQRIYHPATFTFLTAAVLVMSSAPSGYQGGVISTIEKRFQLSNTQAGTISTFYDVMALSTVMFITHFGQSYHQPRVIGCLQLIAGVAMIVNTIPHFIYPPPPFVLHPPKGENDSSTEDYMCQVDGYDEDAELEGHRSGALLNQFAWMYLGTFLASFSSPVVALALPYIDDSVNRQSTSIYAGVLLAAYSIGSVLGYFLAALCLSVPAYPTLVDNPSYPKDPSNPNWLGAWWLGYLFVGLFLLCLSPLFFIFPKRLPRVGSEKKDEDQQNSTTGTNTTTNITTTRHADSNGDGATASPPETVKTDTIKSTVKEFLYTMIMSIVRICTNIPVMALYIVGFLHLASFAGVQLFSAQYMQFQFGLEARITSLLLGLLVVPSGAIGTMVGGYCIKKFGQTRKRMAWLLVFFTSLSFLLDPVSLILGCPTGDVAGVTKPYNYSTGGGDRPAFPGVNVSCNSDCHCALDSYRPVCGEDGLTYVTPCFAGCTTNTTEGDITNYSDCACIPGKDEDPGTARSGECRPFCVTEFRLYFIYGLFWSTSITLMTVPGLMLTLRCVSDDDRSLTMTIGNVMSKIFGQIPAPLYFGAVIDATCILHQTVSGEEGNCLLYNNYLLRWGLNGLTTLLHLISLIVTIFAALVICIQDRDKNLELEESDGHRPLTGVAETDGQDDPSELPT